MGLWKTATESGWSQVLNRQNPKDHKAALEIFGEKNTKIGKIPTSFPFPDKGKFMMKGASEFLLITVHVRYHET
jgi:hypothetical protein